jgi:hypothetical protein
MKRRRDWENEIRIAWAIVVAVAILAGFVLAAGLYHWSFHK